MVPMEWSGVNVCIIFSVTYTILYRFLYRCSVFIIHFLTYTAHHITSQLSTSQYDLEGPDLLDGHALSPPECFHWRKVGAILETTPPSFP